ncbi:MAG: nucleotidyltransferase family protein [Gemmatimonadota bacterium]|nr:nucleotidyltransferase family protein [Gemmatimonadota bacterium]
MTSPTAVYERLHDVLGEVAQRLKLRGPDPALELAGRFGVRRWIERHVRNDGELPPSPWLQQGASLRKEARQLSRALTDADVRHCFFKGIALIGRFYRIDERHLADIDLLIDRADRTRALTALHAHGYGQLGDARRWGPATGRPGVTLARTDTSVANDHTELLLDLHWGLESLGTLLPDEEVALPPTVWARVRTEQGLPVLPDEYHAAVVLHHLVRHDMLHVRGLLDFTLLWDAIPREAGQELSYLARALGVERALRVVGRVLVDDLRRYPLRGVRLGPSDWRDRAALRELRLQDWLVRAARQASPGAQHVTVTRSLAWRRFLLADAARPSRLMREVMAPPSQYLRWRWPGIPPGRAAWRRNLVAALRA